MTDYSIHKTAKHTKHAAREARKQTQMMREANLRAAIVQGPPPCWVLHPNDPAWLIWWDGQRYTEHVRPISP